MERNEIESPGGGRAERADAGPHDAGAGSRRGLIGAVAGALAASVCCLGPLLLLSLGVGGAWIGNLTALEPYHPLFFAVTLGFLGFSFYRVYGRRRAEACAPGSACARPGADRTRKTILWVMTGLIALLLALPYAVPRLGAGGTAGNAGPGTGRVVLAVENMSCSACVVTIRKSLTRLVGVKAVAVTLDPPRAVVTYDPAAVSAREMTEATGQAGYPSHIAPGEKE